MLKRAEIIFSLLQRLESEFPGSPFDLDYRGNGDVTITFTIQRPKNHTEHLTFTQREGRWAFLSAINISVFPGLPNSAMTAIDLDSLDTCLQVYREKVETR